MVWLISCAYDTYCERPMRLHTNNFNESIRFCSRRAYLWLIKPTYAWLSSMACPYDSTMTIWMFSVLSKLQFYYKSLMFKYNFLYTDHSSDFVWEIILIARSRSNKQTNKQIGPENEQINSNVKPIFIESFASFDQSYWVCKCRYGPNIM